MNIFEQNTGKELHNMFHVVIVMVRVSYTCFCVNMKIVVVMKTTYEAVLCFLFQPEGVSSGSLALTEQLLMLAFVCCTDVGGKQRPPVPLPENQRGS